MSARLVFGMPDADYFAVEALSQTLIKELLVSPLDGWWASWMNPAAPQDSDTETTARLYGKALHKRLLEGREAFDAAFCARPDTADHPEALRTADDIKSRLRDLGEKVGGTKDELMERLRVADPGAVFWCELESEIVGGRSVIPADWVIEIEARARVLDAMPDVRNAVKRGAPEVAFFWTETIDGVDVPCKAKFDWLRYNAFIIDVKSFDNYLRRNLETAVGNAMANGKYHVQAAWYLRAGAALINAAKRGTLEIDGDAPDGLVASLADAQRPRFGLLFVQSKGAPNVRFREVAEFNSHGGLGMTQNGYFARAREAIAEGLRIFAFCSDAFGTTPWIVTDKPRAFTDDDLPLWMQDTLVR